MKIIQEHKKCIGCGSCIAVCPKIFKLGDDNLASIKDAKTVGENQELETEGISCAQEAAEICPVQIIHIE